MGVMAGTWGKEMWRGTGEGYSCPEPRHLPNRSPYDRYVIDGKPAEAGEWEHLVSREATLGVALDQEKEDLWVMPDWLVKGVNALTIISLLAGGGSGGAGVQRTMEGNAAKVFKMALESNMPSQTLNVGTGVETTFNEVIAHINKILGTDLKPEYVDVPIDIYALRLWSNNEKLERNLNFKTSISVQEGIERVVRFAKKYVAEHPERANDQMYFESLPER